MKHNYTFNYLISYLYKETSILRKLEIENQISEDAETAIEFSKLKSAFRMLPKVQFYPSDKTLKSILEYSQKKGLTQASC